MENLRLPNKFIRAIFNAQCSTQGALGCAVTHRENLCTLTLVVSHLILSLSGPAPRRAAAAAARGWFGNAPPLFPRPFGGAEDPRPPPWHSGVGAPQLLRGYPAAGPAAPPAPTAPPPAPRPAAHGSSQPVAAAPLAQPALDWMPKPRMPEFALQGHGLAAAPQLSDPRGLFERCCFRHRELFCLCVCVRAR